ncbi:MAG: glycoside hydrolase family 13 protein, partial [Clostridia bacterium]|nr:glycoside hydrolase family 13 protein [Clostridia bacterium]
NEVFNTRDPFYLSQTTPVRAGVALRFSLLLHEDCHCCEGWLILRREGEDARWIPLCHAGTQDRFQRWECTAAPERAGLYWYRFEYEGNWRRNVVTRVDECRGDVTPDGADWQLTVTEPDYAVPEGYAGGLIYQIFPDRFFASGSPKENVPADRYLCADWSAQPAWRQKDGPRSLGNDYYGGDLKGITEKLDYLQSLGVTILYLNPIFEAHSNHRYNTADYTRVDPLLGTEEDFAALCREAKARGMAVILDGVFSHTGADSRYYNKYGRYPDTGAYQSKASPYYPWFSFYDWPEGCHSWWGVPSLPEVNEEEPSYLDFICGENGVLRRWMRLGASGWRLDVADELPDGFLDRVREAVKAENPDALLLGEVWEDASIKVSHGGRRRFLLGRQVDSVMNYPWRTAILDFVRGGAARDLRLAVEELIAHYPKGAVDLLMNHIGTHDTERVLSLLGGAPLDLDRAAQAEVRLTPAQRQEGLRRLKLAAVLQYTLPGLPSLYYGDEAGVEGLRDPFNRTGYPWGQEDADLLAFYRKLGAIRKHPAFAGGDFLPVWESETALVFDRVKGKRRVRVAVNRGKEPVPLPDGTILPAEDYAIQLD